LPVIYAPLNSVNTYRTPKTVLPLDVVLSNEEVKELCELERLFDTTGFTPAQLSNRFLISSNANVGIHYFCIEKNMALRVLASNCNISPLIAYLIHRKSEFAHYGSSLSNCYKLLGNPVVFNDFNLFKMIFNEVFVNSSDGGHIGISQDLLFSLKTFVKVMPASVIMFLLPFVGETQSEFLIKSYITSTASRANDIMAWLEETSHELAGVPFSWILRAYNIHE
jgi:hypothetical protein